MKLAALLAVLNVLVATACDTPCTRDGNCPEGETCPAPRNRPAFLGDCHDVCEPAPTRGEACRSATDSPDCTTDFSKTCIAGLLCAETANDGFTLGMCVPAADRAVTEICDVDDQCTTDLVCAPYGLGQSAGECAPLVERAARAPCDDDAQCASGACSDQRVCS